MLTELRITTTTTEPIALLHVTVPRNEIQKVMGPGLAELGKTIAAQGIATRGPWFTHHHRFEPGVFDFDIGFVVERPVAPSGRVRASERPAERVATAVYNGGYDGLGAAWEKFDTWIRSTGNEPAEDLWERYLVGPESGPDASRYRTEFTRPLR